MSSLVHAAIHHAYTIDLEQNVVSIVVVVQCMMHESGDDFVAASTGGKVCIEYACTRVHVHNIIN